MTDMKQTVGELLELTKKYGAKLIAVTKTVDAARINEAISYGVTAIGENKVQELLSKYDALDKDGVEIHFIGTLQRNKVKYIIDKVDLIQSVDSEKLALTIDKCANSIGKVQDILVEVNVSGEESKSGVAPDELIPLLEKLSRLANVKVRGLMCIPSPETFRGENKKFFDAMCKMVVDIEAKTIDNISMDILSMGMSADYETALECGSTMVRIGTKIFGKRNYTEV